MTEEPPVPPPVGSQFQDLWFRLALSPVFGFAVPSFSGLIDVSRHTTAGLIGAYAAYSALAFVIWEGNRRLHVTLSRRDDFLERPWHRARLLFTVIVLFTIPVATALLLAIEAVTGDPGVRPFAIPTAVLAIVAISAVITNVYETVFLLRGWESARLRSARTEAARLAAELARLTREVDPHFLFNNLHALQHLVEKGDQNALPFIEALADTYRYMLASRNAQLVSLQEELRALEHHRLLAATRYGGLVHTEIAVDPAAAHHLYLPPVSLGELLQNALKHNDVTEAHPVVLHVSLLDHVLVVANQTRPRARRSPSTGVGLNNLAERVRLFTGSSMTWGNEGARFVVRIPLKAEGRRLKAASSPQRPTEPDGDEAQQH